MLVYLTNSMYPVILIVPTQDTRLAVKHNTIRRNTTTSLDLVSKQTLRTACTDSRTATATWPVPTSDKGVSNGKAALE